MFELPQSSGIQLERFTFESLHFCQTPVAAYRGDQFRLAMTEWYLPAIRSGTAPPLGFLLDVGNLLIRPSLGFDHRPTQHRATPEFAALVQSYCRMLMRLREQVIFAEVVALVENLSDVVLKFRAVGQFLKFLLVEFHRLKSVYSFESRQLTFRGARMTRKGLVNVDGDYKGKRLPATIDLGGPVADGENELASLLQLYRWIAEFYDTTRLDKFISPEERLMVEIAARNPVGVDSADFCLIKRLLEQSRITPPEDATPVPRYVELTVPTESMQVDGPTAGYVDVNTRAFTGNIGDILPAELATSIATDQLRAQVMQYQFYERLVNGGVPHYVRENIVCIEREFRVLVTFVVDAQPKMHSVTGAHPDFVAEGVHPYVRGRALMAGMLRDLALFFPREDVHLEVILSLWDAGSRVAYSRHFHAFDELSVEQASDDLGYARRLINLAPSFFDHRIRRPTHDVSRDIAESSPLRAAADRHRAENFHARHVVLFTSRTTAPSFLRSLGESGVIAGPASPNLQMVVDCDVEYHSVGVVQPPQLADLNQQLSGPIGRLGESDVRARFLDEVIAKATGRPALSREVTLEEATR